MTQKVHLESERPVRRRISLGEVDASKAESLRRYNEIVGHWGCYPWNAPGMPGPGPNFVRAADALSPESPVVYENKTKKGQKIEVYQPSETLSRLYSLALRKSDFFLNIQVKPGYNDDVRFLPGHIWGTHYHRLVAGGDANYFSNVPDTVIRGPVPADVMVIGKCLGMAEDDLGVHFCGPAGRVLVDALARLRAPDVDKWYMTTLIKFKLPGVQTNIKASWISDCLPLLHQELRIVRPRLILCLGADSTKALLGKSFSVGSMAGRAINFTYPVHFTAEDKPQLHTAKVMTVHSPSDVARDPSKQRVLDTGLSRFYFLLGGGSVQEKEPDIDHRVIRTLEEADALLEEAEADCAALEPEERLVAWDAEWEGSRPQNDGSYLRTVQMSWGPKKAAVFVLAAAGGAKSFVDENGKGAVKRLFRRLQAFMEGKRACGHFIVADLEWLSYHGLDLIRDCPVALDTKKTPGYLQLKAGKGWLDSAAMSHAIEETGLLGLEVLAMRYTSAPRYDLKLEEWKKKQKDETKEGVNGYGTCPDDILLPYALYDADSTRRIVTALLPRIEADYDGRSNWEALWESQIALRATLTMVQHGVYVDKNRIDELTMSFLEARSEVENHIKEKAHWPDFKLRSVMQMKEFLFGTRYNGKLDEEGNPIRIRPEGAISLKLEPLLDTSKPPRRWVELVERNLVHTASPSTSKLVLGIMARECQDPFKKMMLGLVRDQRFLDQVLKSVLRTPQAEADGFVEDDDGNMVYDGGMYSHICSDGRVRCTMLPFAETGRWKCRRPNLQNISKTRDKDYKRLLGERYKTKLRSILTATPGYAFVEFDYKGAELLGMAIMSGDLVMIDHATRALHPDEGYDEKGNPLKGGKFPHPQYYDIHSNIAVLAFGLNCLPTKKGLDSIGKLYLRNIAKTVIFGVAYGRGAKAIALAAREEGVIISPEEAQEIIDTIFRTYKKLGPFFEEARRLAVEVGVIESCFGRKRRFPKTTDRKLQEEFGRQAMNFPVQSMVASAVDRGLARMDEVIRNAGLTDDIRLILQIHDAGLLEVKYEYLDYVINELIPYCMIKSVPIYPTSLEGIATGEGPFNFSVDITVERRWGEKFSLEECQRFGIPEQYAA